MVRKSLTKDEQFLLKLKEIAESKGDHTLHVCRYLVGSAISANPKSVDGMVKHLAQTNFIKRGEGTEVQLTFNGLRLVETITTTK
jgi:hypothetical protein